MLTVEQLEQIGQAWETTQTLPDAVREGIIPPVPEVINFLRSSVALLLASGVRPEGRT